MTSIYFVNGKQPNFSCKWKTTSTSVFVRQIEDNHNVFVDGRRAQFGNIGKATKILLKLAMILLAPASTELG